MKLKFWLEGRGGMRSASKIVELPDSYEENQIKEELDNWKDEINCHSEYITYGWDEIKD